MRTVNVHEAKSSLSALLAAVEAGEVITIARAGHPVARLIAVDRSPVRELGYDEGADFWIAEDFDTFVPPGFDEYVS